MARPSPSPSPMCLPLFFFSLLLLASPSLSCSLAPISPFATVFTTPALANDPNIILTRAYVYADGLSSLTLIEIDLTTQRAQESSLSWPEDIYRSEGSFLSNATAVNWDLTLTEEPPRWIAGFSTFASHRISVSRNGSNETLVDLLLDLPVFPGSSRSEIAIWVSEEQRATFLLTGGTLSVVSFDTPQNISNSFTTDVQVDYSSLVKLYDSVGVVYVTYPCCLCVNGAYYAFSATKGLTFIPVNIGSSVYDPRTRHWVDVSYLGRVTAHNLETHESVSFELDYKAFNWRILAIALPSFLVVLLVSGMVTYRLYVHRQRLFRPHRDKPMTPLTSSGTDRSPAVKEEA